MGEWANLIWNPYRWRPVEGYYFFTIPLSSWRTPLSMVPHAWVERWRNGKDILWGITSFTSLHARKLPLMWPLWHKAILVNKRRGCIARVFISKQYIFCLPNTSELVKHEFWDWIQAWTAWWRTTFIMLELCEVKTNSYDSFNWNKPSLGKGFLRKSLRKSWFGTSSVAWHFGPYGSNTMTKCFTKNVDMNPKLITHLGWPHHVRWGGLGKGGEIC